MKLVALLFFLAHLASSQIAGRFVPGPVALAAVGTWEVELCNDGPVAVTVSPERVSMASGALQLLRPSQALPLLTAKQQSSRKFVLATVAEYALIASGAIGGGGLFAIGTRGLGALAVGTGLAHQLENRWRSEVPAIPVSASEDLFARVILLDAGGCSSRSVYAAKQSTKPMAVKFTLFPEASQAERE